MEVPISVPLAADVPLQRPYMSDELTIAWFTPAAKIALSRVYAGLRAANATLADGAPVDSTATVFQWFAETVATADEGDAVTAWLDACPAALNESDRAEVLLILAGGE